MDKPTFLMLIGLPASGKSYKAQELAKEYNATIYSSDALREEMFGDVNDQGHNQKLFTELHKRIKDCLREGKSAIYDACNISYKRRMSFLAELKNIPCEKIAFLMATPYEVCLERNAQRERKVPEEVIKRMYMNFWVPATYEGFDKIQIVYNNFKGYYGKPVEFYNKYKDYDQHNSHHALSLGKHCKKAAMYFYETGPIELFCAAYVHDAGKPFCASFINKKGETTEECHYYGHEHPSSYMSLFYDYATINPLDVAILIVWHMRPYLAWKQSEKAMQKDRNLLGESLFHDILLLHNADKAAH